MWKTQFLSTIYSFLMNFKSLNEFMAHVVFLIHNRFSQNNHTLIPFKKEIRVMFVYIKLCHFLHLKFWSTHLKCIKTYSLKFLFITTTTLNIFKQHFFHFRNLNKIFILKSDILIILKPIKLYVKSMWNKKKFLK